MAHPGAAGGGTAKSKDGIEHAQSQWYACEQAQERRREGNTKDGKRENLSIFTYEKECL